MEYIKINPNDHIICVNISKTYDSNERADNYDCARHYWVLSKKRAENANLVFAIVHGIVVAVFQPIRWYKSENPKWSNRYEFEGTELTGSLYIGKCVWNEINPKSQNPVAYINC